MKIYIQGQDAKGWSIDHDKRYLKKFIDEIGHTETNNILLADVVHAVVWNQLLLRMNYFLRFKRVIATASNFINLNNPNFKRATRFVDLWIAPSQKQLGLFKQIGINAVYQPFYVDNHIFSHRGHSRQELAELLRIDYALIRDKILLGSFQRDTEGADLLTPKWQKGPELLVEALGELPNKKNWILILTGPRRHYVIDECERRAIPYYYFGNKPVAGIDDIGTAIKSFDTMALLYNLIDCYLVTSQSEGGPKAILESAFCKTMIYSTRVGFAEDMLVDDALYDNKNVLIEKLRRIVSGYKTYDYYGVIKRNYNKSTEICSYLSTLNRWKTIYELVDEVK